MLHDPAANEPMQSGSDVWCSFLHKYFDAPLLWLVHCGCSSVTTVVCDRCSKGSNDCGQRGPQPLGRLCDCHGALPHPRVDPAMSAVFCGASKPAPPRQTSGGGGAGAKGRTRITYLLRQPNSTANTASSALVIICFSTQVIRLRRRALSCATNYNSLTFQTDPC